MRLLPTALAALLLVGCAQPSDPGQDFQPSCPAWIKYPHNAQIIDGALLYTNQTARDPNFRPDDLTRWDFRDISHDAANDTWKPGTALGDGHLLAYQGRPLDQVVLDFHMRERATGQPARLLYVEDAELLVRFHASQDGYPVAPLEAYDQAQGKESAKHEWVFRSDPGSRYSLLNLTLRLDLAPPDEEPFPRGVFIEWQLLPNLDNDIDTPSIALMKYSPEFWYRSCDADGTRY